MTKKTGRGRGQSGRRKRAVRRRRRDRNRYKWIAVGVLGSVCLVFGCIAAILIFRGKETQEKPEELLLTYMNHVAEQDYEAMYAMIDWESSRASSKEDFIARNANIYEGIGMQNMQVENIRRKESREKKKKKDEPVTLLYQTTFDTTAGEISFENEADFVKGEEGYALVWNDSLIFPELSFGDKVKITTSEAVRGEILDRNGRVLAGKGTASSVGIVPGKLQERESALGQIGDLLGIEVETIEKKLAAGWVKEDSFVPIATIPKVRELELTALEPGEEVLKEAERQEQLLAIPGVMISDTEVREYPLKEAAAHLIGYIQNVTAEDLEKHAGEGYHTNSVIGRSGMESLFEEELRGQNGCDIYIVDGNGTTKKVLASIPKIDGEDVRLTIDAKVQTLLYEQFKEDKSCSVAMNPYTGEILALVSTPAFDDNDFILGMSAAKWTELNEDPKQPMYNRFRQAWCPGSSLKPIIGAIGLETGAIDPEKDYGNEGLRWQKDAGWGDYYVTTLHAYEPAVLENALIYSDNIYFAKAALAIGAGNLTNALDELGFGKEVPFEITVKRSQYSNTGAIESEIQLADSGYGQGQILVNPIHLASLYTSFGNNGNVIRPYLTYQEGREAEIWIPEAFPGEVSGRILEGLKKVVNDANGTGYGAHRDDMVLAGKTGTAEIKASKEDTSGTELGWFAVFTTDETLNTPILIVSMVEDVKEIGGSSYVVKKDKVVLDQYLSGEDR